MAMTFIEMAISMTITIELLLFMTLIANRQIKAIQTESGITVSMMMSYFHVIECQAK